MCVCEVGEIVVVVVSQIESNSYKQEEKQNKFRKAPREKGEKSCNM